MITSGAGYSKKCICRAWEALSLSNSSSKSNFLRVNALIVSDPTRDCFRSDDKIVLALICTILFAFDNLKNGPGEQLGIILIMWGYMTGSFVEWYGDDERRCVERFMCSWRNLAVWVTDTDFGFIHC